MVTPQQLKTLGISQEEAQSKNVTVQTLDESEQQQAPIEPGENPAPDEKSQNTSTSGGKILHPKPPKQPDAQDFIQKGPPLDNQLSDETLDSSPQWADIPKGGHQLPAFPGATGAESSVFGTGRFIFPKKSAEGLFNLQHTPPFPFDKEDGQNVPSSKNPKPHASAPRVPVSTTPPDTVALALSLLTQAPKGGAATLIQTWAQALSQRKATPGAEMLKMLLGTRRGLEQLLRYGYGGTVLQALNRVDASLIRNYLNVGLLKAIAANTGQPALAKSASALLQSVARLASKRVQAPTPSTSPAAAAQSLAQLQQQLARLQRQITSGADAKALQKNLHELQKNLQTFWVQIVPIIKAASAAHQSQLAQAIEVVQHKLNEFLQYAQGSQGLRRDLGHGAQAAGQGVITGVTVALGLVWAMLTAIPSMGKGSI